jgi:hypothetical protein
MPERRIGFIPSVIEANQQERGVFVTDLRTILVANESAPKGFREELKASFGSAADELPHPRPKLDFATVDIETLAKMPGNESYYHMAIEELKIGRGIGGFGIWGKYTGENNKKIYLVLNFVPPKELIKKRRSEGLSRREVSRTYASRCQQVFRKALPPIIAEKVDWKL